MSQLVSQVLVICGHGIMMVPDEFVPILSSVLCPKTALISLPISRLPKGDFRSLCPHLSMKVITCLSCVMSLSPNFALTVLRYVDPIVVADKNRCTILVQFMTADLSVSKMDIFLAVVLPNLVVSDGVGRFLR